MKVNGWSVVLMNRWRCGLRDVVLKRSVGDAERTCDSKHP